MRNSLAPISFPKEQRFKAAKQSADLAPFYDLKDVF